MLGDGSSQRSPTHHWYVESGNSVHVSAYEEIYEWIGWNLMMNLSKSLRLTVSPITAHVSNKVIHELILNVI